MNKRHFDVLILTALHDEYTCLCDNIVPDAGSLSWETIRDRRKNSVVYGSFRAPSSDSPFTVLVGRCGGMGVSKTERRAHELARDFSFSYLAMCGVCAGDPEKLSSGNVVVADEVWRFGPGKQLVLYEGETRTELRQEEIESEKMEPSHWIEDTWDFGKEFIKTWEADLSRRYPADGGQFNFQVEVGRIQTVPDVTIDRDAFKVARDVKRGTLALEMEGIGIACAAKSLGVNGWILAKGVQDHARPALGRADKNDMYRQFAGYASARFLIEFLRRHISSISQADTSKMNANTSVNILSPVASVDQSSDIPLLVDFTNCDQWCLDKESQNIINVACNKIHLVVRESRSDTNAQILWAARALNRPYVHVTAILYEGTKVREKFLLITDSTRSVYLPIPMLHDDVLVVSKPHSCLAELVTQIRSGGSNRSYLATTGIRVI